MPALPSIAGCLKFILGYTIGSDSRGESVLHFTYSGGPPSVSDLTSIAGTAATSLFAHLQGLASDDITFADLYLVDLSSDSAAEYFDTLGSVGTRSGDPLPGEVAALVNYPVTTRYRGGHPRTYFPFGVAADVLNPQQWESAFLTAVNTGVGDFQSAVTGASSGTTVMEQQVAVSYYKGFTVVTSPTTGRARNVPKLRTGGPVLYQLGTPECNSKPASQRRRALYRR